MRLHNALYININIEINIEETKRMHLMPQVQSVAWQWEGKLVASQAKDKSLRVWDPRSGRESVLETRSHEGVKDSKVLWVADDRLLSSGFSQSRARELIIRDTRWVNTKHGF